MWDVNEKDETGIGIVLCRQGGRCNDDKTYLPTINMVDETGLKQGSDLVLSSIQVSDHGPYVLVTLIILRCNSNPTMGCFIILHISCPSHHSSNCNRIRMLHHSILEIDAIICLEYVVVIGRNPQKAHE